MAYTPKTQKNNTNPLEFLNSLEDSRKKEDSLELLKFFQEKTNEKGNMWGESIIGFGEFHYKTKSNCESDWFRVGFSPRKSYISLYVVPYLKEQEKLIKRIGKAKVGKSCINIKTIDDIDLKILEKLITLSMNKDMSNYGWQK